MKTILKSFAALILFCLAMVLVWNGLIDARETSARQDTQRIEEAIKKAAVECYANEGFYPEDLTYLKEHYGLLLDEKAYFISYYVEGQNMMPDIYVYRKGDHHE